MRHPIISIFQQIQGRFPTLGLPFTSFPTSSLHMTADSYKYLPDTLHAGTDYKAVTSPTFLPSTIMFSEKYQQCMKDKVCRPLSITLLVVCVLCLVIFLISTLVGWCSKIKGFFRRKKQLKGFTLMAEPQYTTAADPIYVPPTVYENPFDDKHGYTSYNQTRNDKTHP